MAHSSALSKIILSFLKKYYSIKENNNCDLGEVRKVLIVRQHNQLGDMLASVSLFRAIKEKYKDSKLFLIVSPVNKAAVIKNKYVDGFFVFDKPKVFLPIRFIKFIRYLRQGFDVVIVPSTVSVSFTSNLISRISKSRIRIGVKNLDGKENESSFFFDQRIELDWRKEPDSNVADFILDIVRPFGITTNDYSSNIAFDDNDLDTARNFVNKIMMDKQSRLIGIHVGAGKPQNKWSLNKYIKLVELLEKNYKCCFYITGSKFDKEELNYVKEKSKVTIHQYLNHSIPEVAALISISDLYVTNDTGLMHVAGTTQTPQISLFGQTNPFNWAPYGKDKIFLRKSDLIDDIETEDVFEICKLLLNKSDG
ncbi:MAG: glycosyltransferase family 9 protein [Ignavibacterium sp.]|jgi:heptosyltransferase-2|nr:glycosyltransferase family 9 protein [Ignavibacterium sp.]